MLAKLMARPVHKIATGFVPKISIAITRKNFTIRTASSPDDIKDLMRLRYDVFHREYMGKRFPIGYDFDELDSSADHLMIIDNRTGKVVGTYRMILSGIAPRFYSQSEFVLDTFLREEGLKLELGRACIRKEFRSGILVHLLWRGISEYLRVVGAKFVFGCSSVKTTDLRATAMLMAALQNAGHTASHYGIEPTPAFRFSGYQEELQRQLDIGVSMADVEGLLPSLVHAYLSMGGKVHGAPALDSEYRCIDLLTILPMEQFTEKFTRKYLQ